VRFARYSEQPDGAKVLKKRRVCMRRHAAKILIFNALYAKIMKWRAKIIRHNGENRIAVESDGTYANFSINREFNDCRWSQSKRTWHLPDTPENRRIFGFATHEPVLRPEVRAFSMYLKSKRYSDSTVKTYTDALRSFLSFFGHQPARELTDDDLIRYNNEYVLANGLSVSYQNQIVNAIKLFFLTVEDRKIDIDRIHRPKRPKVLPNVLSKKEVKALLEANANIKHRVMLCLIYSCGLRRSELLHLKPHDIDSMRNVVVIRQAKGKKDRIVPLSPKILEMLRTYYTYYKPKTWLFEGQIKGEQLSENTLRYALASARLKAGIDKPVTLHWLRHSYATHLLESGTDLRYIQEMLGHNSSRTTEIYTHVSTQNIQLIKSPFDDL
jgi:integrase/recombinase XerD